jgi:hypothetical protein
MASRAGDSQHILAAVPAISTVSMPQLLSSASMREDAAMKAEYLTFFTRGSSNRGGAEAVGTPFFLKRRYARRFSEKCREGCAKVDDGLLRCALGDVEHPKGIARA